MNEPLKPRIDFSQPLPDKVTDNELRGAISFSAAEAKVFSSQDVLEQSESQQQADRVETLLNKALKPKVSLWRRLVTVSLFTLLLSLLLQAGHWVLQAWQTQDWPALVALAASAMIILAGVGSLFSEWRRLFRLRQRADERERARELLNRHDAGKGGEFCEKLAQQAGFDPAHPALLCWRNALHESQSDREVVTLYATVVQPVLDKQVQKEISRCAAESALMIAVSPLALVDMAFVAWRNIRLVNRIAAIYGIELGYFSRIRLFRLVLLNIAFAGASELIREMGMDWMSQDLLARLSARAAQGIGVGLLTARLGIKAMELCRPLPWLSDDKPKLGDFRRQLIEQIKGIRQQ